MSSRAVQRSIARLRAKIAAGPRLGYRRFDALVPALPIQRLWRSLETPAALWMGREGGEMVDLGLAAAVSASGPRRFATIRHRAAVPPAWRPSGSAPEPRWLGGFSFGRVPPGGPWEDFGEARFTLPRWRYLRRGARAWLTCLASPGASRSDLFRDLDHIEAGLLDADVRAEVPPPLSVRHLSRREWAKWIESALRLIRTGGAEKLVLARASRIEAPQPIPTHDLVTNLIELRGLGTVYAFRRGDGLFAGVTPERLIRVQGLRAETEALAGTSSGSAEAGRRLSRSRKDHHEHQLVVGDILERLGPWCRSTRAPRQPSPERFGELTHLRTRVSARLAEPTHILELVQALHPTPAVCGLPTAKAAEWIQQTEPEPRGWYSGPVGWFDPEGDGDFAVALRCCLIRGLSVRVYAGAGVVEGSTAEGEYRETGLKQRTMLRLLGAA